MHSWWRLDQALVRPPVCFWSWGFQSDRKGSIGGKGLVFMTAIRVRTGIKTDATAQHSWTFSGESGFNRGMPSLSLPLMSSSESHSSEMPAMSSTSSSSLEPFFGMGQRCDKERVAKDHTAARVLAMNMAAAQNHMMYVCVHMSLNIDMHLVSWADDWWIFEMCVPSALATALATHVALPLFTLNGPYPLLHFQSWFRMWCAGAAAGQSADAEIQTQWIASVHGEKRLAGAPAG